MSSRYVWARSTLDKSQIARYSPSGGDLSFKPYPSDVFWSWKKDSLGYTIRNGPVYYRYGSGYSIQNGKFTIDNSTLFTIEDGERIDTTSSYARITIAELGTSAQIYWGVSNSSNNSFSRLYYADVSSSDDITLADSYNSSSGIGERYELKAGPLASVRGNAYIYDIGKGTANGTVSNAAQGTYPQDGVSGNYWYTYQGSDNIDAAAVTYSLQEPRGGQPITINVSASTGNEYGGTVRYTYQVQLAGGAWQTIATNSTATSCQYTIPAGTTTFAARVLASDTWGFSSSDYTTGATLTVINNEPPSAPDGITIGPVLGGEQTTITWGEATDTDGTIASYQLERQIDNGDTWTQIYTGLTRSYDDTINSEWATVNYRVRAVDDDGEAGPYTTGTMQTVNAGWLYFSGPPEDMGDKPAPFTFAFSIGSTTEGTTDISVSVLLDDEVIYTGTPDAGEQVSLEIDTRLSYEGEHTIVVTFEKANLLGDQYVGTYNVPTLEIPDGGHAVQFYDSDGVPVFPNTFARQVFAQRGNSAARLFDRVYSGTYTGTGTSGSSNPLKFRLSFRPKIVAIQAAGASAAAFGLWVQSAADPAAQAQGSMVVYNGSTQSLATVQWDDTNMILSIYAASAAQQLNVSGQLYGIFVGGAMA